MPAPTEPADSPSHPLRGRLLVAAAAILWSTSGLFAKSDLFADWPEATRGTALAFWRAAFAGLFLLPAVRRPAWNPRLFLASLTFPAMYAAYLTSMTFTTAANATWLQSTAPLWVFVIGCMLLRTPFNRRDLAPLVLGTLGAAVIVGCELASESLTPTIAWGVGLGLFSGVLYAMVVLSLRGFRTIDAAWLVVVNQLMAAVVLAPFTLLHCPWPQGTQWLALVGFGIVQLGVPYLFFANGLRHIPAQEASLIGLLEPVLVPVWVFLSPVHEVPAWWTISGAALILVGLLLRYRR